MGVEIVLGALIAWAVAKARRAGKALDGVVDEVIDIGTARARDKVRDVVLGKLETDSAVQKLEEQVAETGTVSELTRRRVSDAVEAAVEDDPVFAAALKVAVADAEQHPALTASHGGTAVAGSATASGQDSIAIGAAGRDINLNRPQDPHQPGRA